jgi:hypothetical protein
MEKQRIGQRSENFSMACLMKVLASSDDQILLTTHSEARAYKE